MTIYVGPSTYDDDHSKQYGGVGNAAGLSWNLDGAAGL